MSMLNTLSPCVSMIVDPTLNINRRFKIIKEEVAKATKLKSGAVTHRAKTIHNAELGGDSQALEKVLAKLNSPHKAKKRQEDEDVVHYDSKADDVMEKYFPNSWQHPGKQD